MKFLFFTKSSYRWISDQNRNRNKLAYFILLCNFCIIKIAKLYVISQLIWHSFSIGNPPTVPPNEKCRGQSRKVLLFDRFKFSRANFQWQIAVPFKIVRYSILNGKTFWTLTATFSVRWDFKFSHIQSFQSVIADRNKTVCLGGPCIRQLRVKL